MINLKGKEPEDIRITNAENITLESLYAAMDALAKQNNIPMGFYADEVTDGRLSKGKRRALIAYHPEHLHDYYNIAMILTKQGSYGNVSVYWIGTSKQGRKHSCSKAFKATDLIQSSLIGVGSAAVIGLMGIGTNKGEYLEEEMYYEQMESVIGSVLTE